MKRILMIGACDKSDLLIYMSKILTTVGYKVLLIDATLNGNYQYAISRISSMPLCEHDGFDLATGFVTQDIIQSYDYVLIDVDHESYLAHYSEHESLVLVANYDRHTIIHNQLLMEHLYQVHGSESIQLCKVIYHTDCHLDENYLDSTLDTVPIEWIDPTITIHYDEYDHAVKLINQFASKVQLKGLSRNYRSNLLRLLRIVTDLEENAIKKALKNAIRRKLS